MSVEYPSEHKIAEAENIRPSEESYGQYTQQVPERPRSPPPILPELGEMGGGMGHGDGGFMNGDIFRDIK